MIRALATQPPAGDGESSARPEHPSDQVPLDHAAADRVRPEYQALVDGFPSLLAELGAELSDRAMADLGTLMAAIECIDRVIDALPAADARRETSTAIVDALADDIESRVATGGAELARRVSELRALAIRHGVVPELIALAREALDNTEQMRRVTDRDQFFARVEREGELTVELALLIAPLEPLGASTAGPPSAARRAASFLRAVAAPANLADKLVDLRGDHRRGEVAVDPGLVTHLRLAKRLVQRSWAASALYSTRWRFTWWGLRWLANGARDQAVRRFSS